MCEIRKKRKSFINTRGFYYTWIKRHIVNAFIFMPPYPFANSGQCINSYSIHASAIRNWSHNERERNMSLIIAPREHCKKLSGKKYRIP